LTRRKHKTETSRFKHIYPPTNQPTPDHHHSINNTNPPTRHHSISNASPQQHPPNHPPELCNRIYHDLAQSSTRVILGRKFLASHALGEHDGILPAQFACAAALEPLSMTCQQVNMESAALLVTLPDPPAYHLVVNNFDLDQVGLFGDFMDCTMDCKRKFALRFQFDSGVLESALELERRVDLRKDLEGHGTGNFRCRVQKFMRVFALTRDSKVFGGKGGGGGGEGGGASRAMTELQARETVQVLRRISADFEQPSRAP
jgi:hypothetical protein